MLSSLIEFRVRKIQKKLERSTILDFLRTEVTEFGLRQVAERLRMDSANLNKMPTGKRQLSEVARLAAQRYFATQKPAQNGPIDSCKTLLSKTIKELQHDELALKKIGRLF